MKCETGKLRVVFWGAVETVSLLVLVFVAGPVALAILDAVRLASGLRDSSNIID
jgi:hypothetical protein